MSRRTSFNYNDQLNGGRRAQALSFIKRYKPTTFLTMNGHDFAKQIAKECPDTISIHRRYFAMGAGDEGSIWKRDDQLGPYIDHVTYGLTPADNVWIYILNEPKNEDGKREQIPILLNWLIKAMHELNRRGFKGVIGNFGPGNFEPWEVDSGVFDEYLRVLGNYSNQGKMLGGWHEYTGFVAAYGVGAWNKTDLLNRDLVQKNRWPTNLPIARVPVHKVGGMDSTMPDYWHILRCTWFDLRCKSIGAPIHRKVITEGFWDRMPDMTREINTNVYDLMQARFGTSGYATIRGPKSYRAIWKYYWPEWSFDRAMYEQLMWLETIYPSNIVGWNIFTWSFGSPDWDIALGFNVGDMDELMTLLINNQANEPGARPVYKSLPAANDPRWQTVIATSTGINIRTIPTTIGNTPIGQVTSGQTVKIITDTAAKEGVWHPILVNNQIAWVSGDVFTYRIPFGEPTKLLPVPFLTQLGTGSNNCLPASVAMTVNYNSARYGLEGLVSVDDIEGDMNNAGGYAHINDAVALSGDYGIDFYSGAPLTWERIKAQIDAGNPVIPLLKRGALKPTFYLSFMGPHFLVVTGYGPGFVVVHDPLSTVGGPGVNWKVPQADFDNAVYRSDPTNGIMQGIFTKRSAVVVPPPPPPHPITEAELAEIRELVARLNVLVN